MDIPQDVFESALGELGFEDDEAPATPPVEGEEEDQAEESEESENDEGDGESDDEDEGSESEEESDEDEDDGESDPSVIEVDDVENVVIRLPDGTEVPLKDGALRQADYTRKTQELAEQRRQLEEQQTQLAEERAEVDGLYEQVESWFAERVHNRSSWIVEIAQDSEDPSLTFAKALNAAAKAGLLDEDMVQTFGLKNGRVAERAAAGQQNDEVAALRAEIEQLKAGNQQATVQRELLEEYQRSWAAVVQREGLTFASPADEIELRSKVAQFAVQRQITDLEAAFAAYQHLHGVKEPAPATKTPDPATVQKKRQARAVTPRSSGGAARPPAKAADIDGAIRQVLDSVEIAGV